VPYQLYPAESVQRHEEGTVVMEFIFDSGWCVRKATIVKSSKYWRLDYVSLKWAMNLRWTPKKTLFTADGEQMVTIPIGWGKSQTKELKSVHIEPAQSSTQGN
jgi:outer membrane biosynthesis protein TonB